MAGMSHSAAAAAGNEVSFRRRRKQEIEERSEERAVAMVVINAIFNFLLRLPELFFMFSLSKQLFHFDFFSSFPNLPLFVTDLAYFFYILTFTTNFLIYYLFNQKFKQSFSQYMHVKKRS
jgi:hypothetical protein